MEGAEELLPQVWAVRLNRLQDHRGAFVKTFSKSSLPALANFDMHEEFYSISHRVVIRGMHFQLPPHDHAKLVF